ncbi:VapE domain-containing protein [Noviherbaspirillum denitrificans]|nr:VapE domain-containing protein [Noviherbaspirillum denitrificans]
MRIRLSGHKAGYWSDFAMDGEAGRDLISLYAYVNDLSQGKACAAVARDLGIELTPDPNYTGKPAASSAKPKNQQKPAPAQAAKGVEEAPKKARTEWVPVLPVPENAGPYPRAHVVRGKPERLWEYRDQERRLLGVIYRFVTSDGGKEVLPCVYARHAVTGKADWRWLSFPEPRPLYLPAPLREGFPVLVVEGEKCADAALDVLGHLVDVVSWPGGGKAVSKADWSPLAGRKVIIWADADAKTYKDGHPQAGEIRPEHEQPGMVAATKISEILAGIGCEVRLIDIPAPGVKPDGWDIADLLGEGATPDDVAAWLDKLRPLPDVEAAPADEIPDYMDAPPPEGASTAPPAGARKTFQQIRAMMIGTASGGVKGCRENVYIALQNDPRLIGLVALDQFSQLQVKRKSPPWPSEPGEWTEGDDFHLGMYLANTYSLVMASVSEIEKAVAQSARENAFNPVTDLLEECADKWDGQHRVVNAFSTYWGAVESEYLQLISLMFFVGLAKRAFHPGVKHDYAPVFEGGQGQGKSTALSILGGQWFADTPFKMGDKDGFLSIQGILLYEIAELEQFNRSEVTAIKAFMSSQTDRYREPYGRRMKNVARRTVFAATTNEAEYFKDTTGNRRFWPVETGRIDLEGLRRDREQLLGEAVHLMRQGELWYPTPDEQATLITPEQEKREIADPWLGRIYDYVQGIDADGETTLGKRNRVTCRELLTRALHIEIGKLGPAKQETMRIAACMRKLGWTKGRETDGARERFYERPVPPAAPVQQVSEENDVALPL